MKVLFNLSVAHFSFKIYCYIDLFKAQLSSFTYFNTKLSYFTYNYG